MSGVLPQNVHGDRQSRFFGGRPEWLKIRMVVRLIRGAARNRHAADTHPGDPLQLLNGRLSVWQWQTGNADQALGDMAVSPESSRCAVETLLARHRAPVGKPPC